MERREREATQLTAKQDIVFRTGAHDESLIYALGHPATDLQANRIILCILMTTIFTLQKASKQQSTVDLQERIN